MRQFLENFNETGACDHSLYDQGLNISCTTWTIFAIKMSTR